MSIPYDLAQKQLLQAYKLEGDRSARDRLIEEMVPLVRALAMRYAGRGESVEDLVQVGSIGLIKAIDRFDIERGVELSTYAVPTIVGEIRRHFRDKAWAVHVPRRLKELNQKLGTLLDDLTAELGRSPTIEELAGAAGADEEEVLEALDSSHAYSAQSLSAPLDKDSDGTLGDTLAQDEVGYGLVDEGTIVAVGLDALEARERRIVELRFFQELTQSQIAAELGISQMHVSRLLRQALQTMRGQLDEQSEVQG
ncbi:MAG: SigB/SigF/SigG family RNA polymerase sigma factor [Gaiellaceae bacterium]